MTFKEYAEKLNLKIVCRRLAGESLRDIAKSEGVSVEWIRAKEAAELKRVDSSIQFDEEVYRDFILHTKGTRQFILRESESNQLMRSADYLYQHLYEKSLTYTVKEWLEKNAKSENPAFLDQVARRFHFAVWNDGSVTSSYGEEGFTYAAKLLKEFRATELVPGAARFIMYGKLDELTRKTAEGLVRYDHIVRTGTRSRMRYFPRTLAYVQPVLEDLRYPDEKTTTANRVYAMNKTVLAKIGIRNGYELHSLMKKCKIEGVRFGKCPRLFLDDGR